MGPKGRALLAAWIDLTMGAPGVAPLLPLPPNPRKSLSVTSLFCSQQLFDLYVLYVARAVGCVSVRPHGMGGGRVGAALSAKARPRES